MQLLNQNYDPAVAVETLSLHPQNPRNGDIGAISKSIDSIGFYGALVAQVSTRFILAGNHRYQSAIENSAEKVPVIWLDVDDETARRVMLADNRLSDIASNDEAALSELLRSIMETTGTLEGTGYTPEDLDDLIRDVNATGLGDVASAPEGSATENGEAAAEPDKPVEVGKPGNTPDDETPEPAVIPVSVPGDLWILGTYTECPHCGTSNDV